MKTFWQKVSKLSPTALWVLVAVDVCAGVVLRFTAHSKLWLDEVLTVNISSHPIGQIVGLLRHDGAPPLYYYLLHFWIRLAGGSDSSVRALSAVFSLAALPMAYLAVRRFGSQRWAMLSVAITSVLPYTVYFGTETRMYSLVMFESVTLLWLWFGDWSNARARWRNATGFALVASALLYTHYWGIYLVAGYGILAVRRILRSRGQDRAARAALLAIGGAFVLWAPWFPVFNEQRVHTGTPWAAPPQLFRLFTWLSGFTVTQSSQHVTMSLHMLVALLLFIAFVLLGTFAHVMRNDAQITLDGRLAPEIRTIAWLTFGSITLGLMLSATAHAAYVPRYASIIAVLLVVVAARGVEIFSTATRVLVALALLSAVSLWTDKWGVSVQRTQAGEVASVLRGAPAGSLVVFCPDQIGPTVARYAPSRLDYVSYPRFDKPTIVNWYDYKRVYVQTPPRSGAADVIRIAGMRDIYLVWSSGYALHNTCRTLLNELAAQSGRTQVLLLKADLFSFYQSMNVTVLRH